MQKTKSTKKSPYDLDNQIHHLLRVAYQRANANMLTHFSEHNITPMQFAALVRLLENDILSQNHLGRLIAMEPANTHVLVRNLKKHKLVITERDSSDRRLILYRLSEKGKKLVKQLIPIAKKSSTVTLGPLKVTEQKSLMKLLISVAAAE